MITLLGLALRNLSRNQRRTLITALAVAFGVAAMVSLQGFVNGFVQVAIDNSVLGKVGAIQIHKAGYLGADEPLKHSLPDDPALMARVAALDGVYAVAPRIAFDGMVSNGSESTMFLATAIDPALEYRACPMPKKRVAPGSQPLAPGRDSDALIGKTLAEALGAHQGSTLVIQSAGPNAAGTNALDVEVSGFLPTLNIIESKRMATVSLALAQDLLRMKGRVTEYVVGVVDLGRVDEVAARVRATLGEGYEVTTWRQMDPETYERTLTIRYVLGFVAAVLFFLVATGIVNTMLMSVFERVREIGTMLAVGVRRRQITLLFLWEAAALGLLGATTGALAGFALVAWLGRRGVTVRPPGGDVTIIRPHVDLRFIVLLVAFSVAGTLLAALYPARKASRLRPVEALRAT